VHMFYFLKDTETNECYDLNVYYTTQMINCDYKDS